MLPCASFVVGSTKMKEKKMLAVCALKTYVLCNLNSPHVSKRKRDISNNKIAYIKTHNAITSFFGHILQHCLFILVTVKYALKEWDGSSSVETTDEIISSRGTLSLYIMLVSI
jgi:hypothetical protein